MSALQRFALVFAAVWAAGAVIGGTMAFWIWFWEEAAFIGALTQLCAIAFATVAALAPDHPDNDAKAKE